MSLYTKVTDAIGQADRRLTILAGDKASNLSKLTARTVQSLAFLATAITFYSFSRVSSTTMAVSISLTGVYATANNRLKGTGSGTTIGSVYVDHTLFATLAAATVIAYFQITALNASIAGLILTFAGNRALEHAYSTRPDGQERQRAILIAAFRTAIATIALSTAVTLALPAIKTLCGGDSRGKVGAMGTMYLAYMAALTARPLFEDYSAN